MDSVALPALLADLYGKGIGSGLIMNQVSLNIYFIYFITFILNNKVSILQFHTKWFHGFIQQVRVFVN